jgi:hypothetical protein
MADAMTVSTPPSRRRRRLLRRASTSSGSKVEVLPSSARRLASIPRLA